MNFFEIIKTIYQKKGIPDKVERWTGIVMSKWLSWDTDNQEGLRSIMPYLFCLSPEQYFCLLYVTIPQKHRVPFFKKIIKAETQDEERFYSKVREVLGWSTRELRINKTLVNKVLLPNRKEWEIKLGIDK